MPTDPEQLADALRASIGLLRRRLRQATPRGELTLPETAALTRLDREGPATAAELARAEQITPQSMGVTLAGLEIRGLVERVPDPADGRRLIISLSRAGAEVLRDRRDARVQQLARALAGEFSDAELDRLIAIVPLLDRLARRL